MYDNKNSTTNWREQTLYGSSRLGTWLPNTRIGQDSSITQWDTVGYKQYELNNHLGNVMVTVTDKRLQHSTDSKVVDYYQADVATAQEYYSFGALMPARTYPTTGKVYRYGFNGKENDNEVKGVGNEQDYGMRIYDGRLGRFLSVDPLSSKFPELTPFQFASNRPIDAIDLDGLEGVKSIEANESGITKIVITKNVVVLTESQKPIPTNATPKQIERTLKLNKRIAQNNRDKIDNAKKELNEYYNGDGGAHDSKGQLVEFKFKMIEVNDFEHKKLDDKKRNQMYLQIGKDNGILATKTEFGNSNDLVAPAGVVTNESSGGDQGLTTVAVIIRLRFTSPEGALSHEVIHTLGVDDNGYTSGGLLNSPPQHILPSEVDDVIKKSYNKKEPKPADEKH